MEALRATFKPEFINRIDEIVIFNALGPEEIKKIVDIQIGLLGKRLEASKITLEITDEARQFLANSGFDPVYGARPLKRAIQRLVQDPLALKILEGDLGEGDVARMDLKDGEVVFQ